MSSQKVSEAGCTTWARSFSLGHAHGHVDLESISMQTTVRHCSLGTAALGIHPSTHVSLVARSTV